MNYLDIFKITPGSIVPSGRSYPENATARVALDVRKADGSVIPGCEISKGDPLTVIDVSYSRQLALVQYPTPGGIKQGYATAKYIDYKNQGNYHNGSTPEPVINYDGSSLGSLDPYETATKLFEVNGLTQVVYNTDKGTNTKSGFVRYAGGSQNVVHVDIPYPNVTNAQMIQYGTSGKGRALRAYKMGNGRNSFIFNCAIHGWEDHWAADGIELTKIGNQLIEHFQNNSTGDFTLYVIPAANPDGLSEGWTNNGPGRCTIVGAVDGNRDFSVGFSAGGAPRNHSGSHPLSVPETRELADFISGIKANTSGETYLIDMHGWEGSMVGDS
ncbi:MAG: M14 family zinc carboxypeptidase, partial [Cetobacterium sp.]|uniref:M14 family zinc carboxypeptidase n=1 Tax=Cetobacterium sp. TaxID=2071632 RepID=UPI003F3C97F1